MVVRAVNVTPPAAGADWSFTVPAQWLPYLYGVTAKLVTAASQTIVPDETGNGHDATIQTGASYNIGATGPFTGGAGNVAVFGGPNPRVGNTAYCRSAASAAFSTANYSMDCWLNTPVDLTGPASSIISLLNSGGSGALASLTVHSLATNPWQMDLYWALAVHIQLAAYASSNAWHHHGLSYDGANFRFYLDGALKSTNAGTPPAPAGTAIAACGGNDITGNLHGLSSAAGFYGTALPGASFANHAAASGSFAAYKAAVLADAPTALYKIGALASGPSRIATLKVTDGTRTVAQFPANFAAATADSFTWSWQVLGPGAQSSTDGTVNSVPIPELAVAAGYVISAKTLDLAGTDQWGPITIWFDDGTGPGPGQGAGSGDASYLNALLVPDNFHGSF